jgi:hypothetical protein
MYWWNQATNETSELGAPKPAAGSVATVEPGGGGLGSIVAQGFAFGVGSSIARMAVGSLLGDGDDDGGDDGGEDYDL